jgi:hypothetical protein
MTVAIAALLPAGLGASRYSPQMSRRSVDTAFVQRLILAFTTGLFLSCAARVSATSAAVVETPAPAASTPPAAP